LCVPLQGGGQILKQSINQSNKEGNQMSNTQLESKKDGFYQGDKSKANGDDISSKIITSESDVHKFLAEEELDYTVQKYQEVNPFTKEPLNSYGSYRTDNKHVFKTGLGNAYTPFQNIDAFRSISELAKNGEVSIARGGVWNGGAETFIKWTLMVE